MTDGEKQRYEGIIKELLKKLFIDADTNLLNKKYLRENKTRIAIKAMKDLANDKRKETKIGTWSLLFCDINNLHMFNNKIGHNEADVGIRGIANIIHKCIRSNNDYPDSIILPDPSNYKQKRSISIRIGGDEFIVILPNCNKEEALLVKDRINKKIAENREATRNMTLSIGIADTTEIELPKDTDDKSIIKFFDDLEDKAAERMRAEKNSDKKMTIVKDVERLCSEIGINLYNSEEKQEFFNIIDEYFEVNKKTK